MEGSNISLERRMGGSGRIMGKPPYYSKVVEKLLNYKEYKQRIKKIELDREEKPLENMGMDYSS